MLYPPKIMSDFHKCYPYIPQHLPPYVIFVTTKAQIHVR